MKREKKFLFAGALLVLIFICWTVIVKTVDVRPVGVNGTDVGLAFLNVGFFKLTGVNFDLYAITDWLGFVPLLVCAGFGILGLGQLSKRKSLRKVDVDILLLGIYYIVVILFYLVFEKVPVNYRPVLINGAAETSYPSSTTLLVLSVMPTLSEQIKRRINCDVMIKITDIFVILFSLFMVTGRLISGVHWFTDIAGGIMLSFGLFFIYKGMVQIVLKSEK